MSYTVYLYKVASTCLPPPDSAYRLDPQLLDAWNGLGEAWK